MVKNLWGRFIKLGDSISQGINAVVFDGSCNESLSGRSHRQKLWAEKWIDKILWFDKGHCKVSHHNDLKYAMEFIKSEVTKDDR